MLKVCFEHFVNKFFDSYNKISCDFAFCVRRYEKIALSADAAYATFKP